MYSNVRYNLYLTLLYILHSIGQHNISFLSRCVMLCSVYLTLAQRGTMTDWKGLFNAMLRRPLVRGLFKAMLKWPHTKGWLWLSEGVNLPLCWNDQKHNRDIRTRSRFWKWGGDNFASEASGKFFDPTFCIPGVMKQNVAVFSVRSIYAKHAVCYLPPTCPSHEWISENGWISRPVPLLFAA